jgi:cysteine-rich repeat protein
LRPGPRSGCACDADCETFGDCCDPWGTKPDADSAVTNCGGSTCGTCNQGIVKTVVCTLQACAPGKPACDGKKPATCNTNGSGYINVLAECAAGKTCAAGQCLAQVCGNGVVEGSEMCDDGNPSAGDGCANCAIECSLSSMAGVNNQGIGSSKLSWPAVNTYTFETWAAIAPVVGTCQRV